MFFFRNDQFWIIKNELITSEPYKKRTYRIKSEPYKKWTYKLWIIKNEHIKNERIKNEIIKKELILLKAVCGYFWFHKTFLSGVGPACYYFQSRSQLKSVRLLATVYTTVSKVAVAHPPMMMRMLVKLCILLHSNHFFLSSPFLPADSLSEPCQQ